LESLSWSAVGSALFHLLVSTLVLVVMMVLVNKHVPWTIVLFPVVVACFLPFVAGTCWLLASLGVYLRDLKQIIAIATMALMFFAPILYPKTLIPVRFRDLLYLNPLTVIVEASQDVLVWNRPPDWIHLLLYLLVSCVFAWMTFAWFEQTRKGFADVV
jgi:lipopolysaccharide transport system permease protein